MIHVAEGDRPLAVARETAYAVLTDYERYGEWVPDVERARLLAAEGDVAVVELRMPRHAPVPIVLEMVRTGGRALLFAQVDRYRRSGLGGRFELRGDTHREEVQLHARLTFGTGLLQLRCRRRLRDALARTLDALAARLGAAPPRAEAAGVASRRRKLLEVVRTTQGLEVRLPDQVVRLSGGGSQERA